jgi:hypothetical protein
LEGLRGSIYANVNVTTFLDAKDLRQALVSRIREIVTAADENDTIMLFAWFRVTPAAFFRGPDAPSAKRTGGQITGRAREIY